MSSRVSHDDLLARAFGPGALIVNAFARRAQDAFYSPQPDETDDLCTALPLTLTRGGVRLCCDARAVSEPVRRLLREDLGVELPAAGAVAPLPDELRAELGAERWCEALIQHLVEIAPPGALLMPQPFQDARLEGRFRLPPALSRALNDKAELPRLIPACAPPPRLLELPSGEALRSAPWPGVRCVVKLSGACAGEGVWPCADEGDWRGAQAAVAGLPGPVLVERWIATRRNLDVEFLVPFDPAEPCEILGAVEQVTGADLRLAGGVCRPAHPAPELAQVERLLLDRILPALRGLGWHGVGGFDVLIDQEGQPWFMDPNLRLTDFTAPLWRSRRLPAGRSMLILPYAAFDGTIQDLRARIAPLAREGDPAQELCVLAALDQGPRLVVQAGLIFEDPDQLVSRASRLRALGLSARALDLAAEVAASPAVGGA